jgi:hypothetical protein
VAQDAHRRDDGDLVSCDALAGTRSIAIAGDEADPAREARIAWTTSACSSRSLVLASSSALARAIRASRAGSASSPAIAMLRVPASASHDTRSPPPRSG